MHRPTDKTRACPAAHLQAACYNIGGFNYVLDDLENGILRGNAPGAATLGMLLKLPWLSKGPFKQGDPRAQHVRPVSAACLTRHVLQQGLRSSVFVLVAPFIAYTHMSPASPSRAEWPELLRDCFLLGI